MAFIRKKIVNGKAYFYKVKSVRKDGKVVQEIIEYYGQKDPRKEKVPPRPFSSSEITDVLDSGQTLALYSIVRKLGLIGLVNNNIPKRQGNSVGSTIFLVAIHKLCDSRPSLNNLREWIETTPLKEINRVKISALTSQNIARVFDKIMFKEDTVDFSHVITKLLFSVARKHYGLVTSKIFYDVTSSYFEGNSCPIAKYGYSRDKKRDKVQINIGLAICEDGGFPIVSETFPGNINDTKTVHDILYKMQIIHNIKDATAIMDRGMGSKNNVLLLDLSDYEYVIGLSSRLKLVNTIKEQNSGLKIRKKGELIKTQKSEERYALKMTKNLFDKRRNVVLIFNPDKQEEVKANIQRIAAHIQDRLKDKSDYSVTELKQLEAYSNGYFSYNQTSKKLELNKLKITQDKKRAGKMVLLTSKSNDSAAETFRQYFSKDLIEKAFQFSKQYGHLRPLFRRLENRVRVDVFITHLGYFLICCLKRELKNRGISLSYDQLDRELRQIKVVTRESDTKKKKYTELFTRTAIQKQIVAALDLDKEIELLSS